MDTKGRIPTQNEYVFIIFGFFILSFATGSFFTTPILLINIFNTILSFIGKIILNFFWSICTYSIILTYDKSILTPSVLMGALIFLPPIVLLSGILCSAAKIHAHLLSDDPQFAEKFAILTVIIYAWVHIIFSCISMYTQYVLY